MPKEKSREDGSYKEKIQLMKECKFDELMRCYTECERIHGLHPPG